LRLTLPAGLAAYAIANPWAGPADQAGYSTLLFVCAIFGAYLIGWFLETTRLDEFKLRQQISDNEFIDTVTRLPTLSGFLKTYWIETARSARFSIPFCAFAIDIGGLDPSAPAHTQAETVRHLASIFLRGRQAGDVVGYAGDNRFLLLLVGSTIEDGLFITERLKNDVASSPLMLSDGRQISPNATFSKFDPEMSGSKMLT
jgi:GGDEF domain-containing protein